MKRPSDYIAEEERTDDLRREADEAKRIAEQERLKKLAEMALYYSPALQTVVPNK